VTVQYDVRYEESNPSVHAFITIDLAAAESIYGRKQSICNYSNFFWVCCHRKLHESLVAKLEVD